MQTRPFLRSGLVEGRRDGLRIHRRLANSSDPVLAAIGHAVRHALIHVDAVHRDTGRSRKRTGCCVRSPDGMTSPPCCAPPSAG